MMSVLDFRGRIPRHHQHIDPHFVDHCYPSIPAGNSDMSSGSNPQLCLSWENPLFPLPVGFEKDIFFWLETR